MSDREMMVEVEGLVKVYPNGTRAVMGIDFTVGQGEFFGFLGPNGAGKTTTMKILSTLLRKTSGRATVAGYDVDRDTKAVRASIGFAMQEVGLDDLATGKDFLVLQGVLYGLTQREAKVRADEMLELVGLTSVAKSKVGTYSGGMRRRIDVVAALMHSPPLLFLDEPTVGLDPQSRLAMWEHLMQINEQGVTIPADDPDDGGGRPPLPEDRHYRQGTDRCRWVAAVAQGRGGRRCGPCSPRLTRRRHG